MKKANYIISAITLVVGIVFLIVGQTYAGVSLDGITSSASWPDILCVLLIGLSIVLALYNTFGKDIPESQIDFKSYEFHCVLIVIAMVVALLISFYYLGCLISLAIFFPIFMVFLGERSWKVIAIYDVVSLVAVYLIFEKLLTSPLAPPIFM